MTDKYSVVYSPAAVEDLKSIFSYIADNLKEKQTAINQTERIRKKIKGLDTLPLRFSRVNWEPWKSMDIRKTTVDNYVIYYRTNSKDMLVTIVRIFYGGRNIEEIIKSEYT